MRVKEKCQHLLTINNHLGLFCYLRLPFAFPQYQQNAMTQVLQGIPGVSGLLQLLCKNTKWAWQGKHEQSFEAAKQLSCQICILTHYDIHTPILWHILQWLGCMLNACDGEHPVAYASHTLTTPERNYTQVECETLTISFAVCRFNQYICMKELSLWWLTIAPVQDIWWQAVHLQLHVAMQH